MSTVLFSCSSGHLLRPGKVLCDRQDGGHLIVTPPREVWERSCLNPLEIARWSLLVAATGRAMLDVLPVLRDGCINYWEAGNWALHEMAEPVGIKTPILHRRVHLHVFGRSRLASHADWRWGESPKFPDFADSGSWSARFFALNPAECEAVTIRLARLMATDFCLPPQAAGKP
ncbi:MAG: hypothetical protein V4772_21820 [Pseudomonadota bacterium]